MGSAMPVPPFPTPEPSPWNPIFASMRLPKPLVCFSNAPNASPAPTVRPADETPLLTSRTPVRFARRDSRSRASRSAAFAARRKPRLDARSAGRTTARSSPSASTATPAEASGRCSAEDPFGQRVVASASAISASAISASASSASASRSSASAESRRPASLAPLFSSLSSEPDPSRITPAETKLDASVLFSFSAAKAKARPPSPLSRTPRYPSQCPPGTYSPPAAATARATRSSSAGGARARGVHRTIGCLLFPPPLSSRASPNALAMRSRWYRCSCDRAGWNPTYAPPLKTSMRHISATAPGRGKPRGEYASSGGDSPRFRAALAAFFAALRPLGPRRSGPRKALSPRPHA